MKIPKTAHSRRRIRKRNGTVVAERKHAAEEAEFGPHVTNITRMYRGKKARDKVKDIALVGGATVSEARREGRLGMAGASASAIALRGSSSKLGPDKLDVGKASLTHLGDRHL